MACFVDRSEEPALRLPQATVNDMHQTNAT